LNQTSELEFDKWSEVVTAVSKPNLVGWIYRGLPSYTYDPISKLERILRDRDIPLDGSLARDEENRAIGFFKRRARQALQSTPLDIDILGWLSLMQHYGAPTRLTDWSASPFVACYFAYERTSLQQDAALWMLNANLCRSQYGHPYASQLFGPVDHIGALPTLQYDMSGNEKKAYEGLELTIEKRTEIEARLFRESIEQQMLWPLPLPILNPDNRMAAQQACFVCLGKLGVNMHDFLSKKIKDPVINPCGSTAPSVRKVVRSIRPTTWGLNRRP
jgi:hypothetical protein